MRWSLFYYMLTLGFDEYLNRPYFGEQQLIPPSHFPQWLLGAQLTHAETSKILPISSFFLTLKRIVAFFHLLRAPRLVGKSIIIFFSFRNLTDDSTIPQGSAANGSSRGTLSGPILLISHFKLTLTSHRSSTQWTRGQDGGLHRR